MIKRFVYLAINGDTARRLDLGFLNDYILHYATSKSNNGGGNALKIVRVSFSRQKKSSISPSLLSHSLNLSILPPLFHPPSLSLSLALSTILSLYHTYTHIPTYAQYLVYTPCITSLQYDSHNSFFRKFEEFQEGMMMMGCSRSLCVSVRFMAI